MIHASSRDRRRISRHAAALALFGWYLMLPPVRPDGSVNANAPLSIWTTSNKYETVDEGKKALVGLKAGWVAHANGLRLTHRPRSMGGNSRPCSSSGGRVARPLDEWRARTLEAGFSQKSIGRAQASLTDLESPLVERAARIKCLSVCRKIAADSSESVTIRDIVRAPIIVDAATKARRLARSGRALPN